MKLTQRGFTLGQLIIAVVAVGAVAMGGLFWHKQHKLAEQTEQIEALLIDMKARLNATLLDQDESATYGDLVNKCDAGATKADEALLELRKLDRNVDAGKIDAATNILTSSRELMRYQRMLAQAHVASMSLISTLQSSLKSIADTGTTAGVSMNYRSQLDEARARLDEASKLRIAAMEKLIAAATAGRGMFSERALIDVHAYSTGLENLKALKEK